QGAMDGEPVGGYGRLYGPRMGKKGRGVGVLGQQRFPLLDLFAEFLQNVGTELGLVLGVDLHRKSDEVALVGRGEQTRWTYRNRNEAEVHVAEGFDRLIARGQEPVQGRSQAFGFDLVAENVGLAANRASQ